MRSGSDSTTIHIRLLDEGTDVFRPTEVLILGDELYRVLPTPDYDPEDEIWEFPPGSIIRAKKHRGSAGDEYMIAVSP